MLRHRIWMGKRHLYICASCRHKLQNPSYTLRRRLYSNDANPSPAVKRSNEQSDRTIERSAPNGQSSIGLRPGLGLLSSNSQFASAPFGSSVVPPRKGNGIPERISNTGSGTIKVPQSSVAEQPSVAVNDEGLLPHERAARASLSGTVSPPAPQAAEENAMGGESKNAKEQPQPLRRLRLAAAKPVDQPGQNGRPSQGVAYGSEITQEEHGAKLESPHTSSPFLSRPGRQVLKAPNTPSPVRPNDYDATFEALETPSPFLPNNRNAAHGARDTASPFLRNTRNTLTGWDSEKGTPSGSASPSPFSRPPPPSPRARRKEAAGASHLNWRDDNWNQLRKRESPRERQMFPSEGSAQNLDVGEDNFWNQFEKRLADQPDKTSRPQDRVFGRAPGGKTSSRRPLAKRSEDHFTKQTGKSAGGGFDRSSNAYYGDISQESLRKKASSREPFQDAQVRTNNWSVGLDTVPDRNWDRVRTQAQDGAQDRWDTNHRKPRRDSRNRFDIEGEHEIERGFNKQKRSKTDRRSLDGGKDEWDEQAVERAEERRRRKAERAAQKKLEAEQKATPIFLPEFISVGNLATALGVKQRRFLHSLGELGFENITADSVMTGETAALIALEYGFDPTVDTGLSRDLKPRPPPEDPSSLPSRPPIVTIMGHVDHGKTTLLDWLRKSSVAAQEHGGITQHIGAFVVAMSSGKHITFLDTPGHAAFLAMRQRGANCTDIVVLVVAADDSVMPQTLEALKHARAAKVPIIVAINKIDKEDARIDQVKADLARHGVEIEDFGGDVQVACVSAKTGQGMDELEENIATLSEILDARADPGGMAEGWVLEASIKSVGKSATVLVKCGTLHPGDCIVAGNTWARIRALRNEAGVEVEEAPPGTPVEILGWRDDLPAAGDEVIQASEEQRARTAVEYRLEMQSREQSSKEIAQQQKRQREAEDAAAAALADNGEHTDQPPEQAGVKSVGFIVRGDVVGSVEAVSAVIMEIGNNEVQPQILRASAGQVSEFDVDYAATSGSVIVNFNNAIASRVKRIAFERGVKILDHSVIYRLSNDIKEVLSAHLDDVVTARVLGEAEVAQIFPINVRGRVYKNIAGCKIRNGLVSKTAMVRVMRKGKKVYEGNLESLKHGKKDVTEMRKGTECGIGFEDFQEFEVGDLIQTYEEVRTKRTL